MTSLAACTLFRDFRKAKAKATFKASLEQSVNGLMILKKVSGNWKELLKSSRIIVTLSI